jgi:hypothetical protein
MSYIARLTAIVVPVLLGSVARADIVYNVNQTITGSSTATGFIKTDGHIGVLAASDILDWSLDLTVPGYAGGSFTLTPGDSTAPGVYVGGSDLTATPTQLLFNFSGSDFGYLLFQVTHGNGAKYYCEEATAGSVLCLQGISIAPGNYSGSAYSPGTGFANMAEAGNQAIASISSVPEPSYFVGLGVLMALVLGGILRQKRFSLARGMRG